MALKLPVLMALHSSDRMQQYLLELDSSHSICVTLSNSALFSPILSYSVGSVDSIKSMRILTSFSHLACTICLSEHVLLVYNRCQQISVNGHIYNASADHLENLGLANPYKGISQLYTYHMCSTIGHGSACIL